MGVIQLPENTLDGRPDEPGSVDRIDVLLRDMVQNFLEQPRLEINVGVLRHSPLEKPTPRDESDHEHEQRSPSRSSAHVIVVGHRSIRFMVHRPIRPPTKRTNPHR